MKYLTPEIEALSKQYEITKSLARKGTSCGIFQDIEYKEQKPNPYQKRK